MLVRSHWSIGEDHSCMLCPNQVLENKNHLIFHCTFSSQCWGQLGIHWIEGEDLYDMIQTAANQWTEPLFQDILILAAWNIWKVRNNKLFEGIIPTIQSWSSLLRSDLNLLRLRVKSHLADFILSFTVRLEN